MRRRELRSGFTTGACAAAAALGAARMLRTQGRVEAVDLPLPAGFIATFRLHGQAFDERSARCFVVKDAGDDPDVTNGVEVHAEVFFAENAGAKPCVCPSEPGQTSRAGRTQGFAPTEVIIRGGPGIGKVTKPGLAVPVGEWAINPVPQRMIREAVRSVFPELGEGKSLRVTLSIPDGEERARRTLNERLGILGGLSILGTTGVVRPVSHQAWTDTIEVALDVALACGCRTVVLSTGRTSEAAAQQLLGPKDDTCVAPAETPAGSKTPLPGEAFVMMGDHLEYALEACHRRGISGLILAVQFAKLVKIACGHPQTHAALSRLDLGKLAEWGQALGLDGPALKKIECANTAREVFAELGKRSPLVAEVAERALAWCRRRAPGASMALLLVGYDGRDTARFGVWPALPQREREP